MNCSEVKEKIPQWLDGELADDESTSVAEHLKACTVCQNEVEFWRELSAILKEELGDITAPPGFANEVMAQLTCQQRTGWRRLLYSWKRSLAVAATFLLMTVGSIGAYLQMGGNIAGHVANNDDGSTAQVSSKEQGSKTLPNNGIAKPGILPAESNGEPDNEAAGNQSTPVRQGGNQATVGSSSPNAVEVEQEPAGGDVSGDSNKQPGNTVQQKGGTFLAANESPEQYALLNTAQDHVIARTLIRVKVEHLANAHNQALSFINNSGAQYEVLGSENTTDGGQVTLKAIVNHEGSGKLQDELKTLGQVVTADTQKDDLNSRYNEKVEQYRSLEAQMTAAQTLEERNQLEVKMAGILAQLKTWEQESNTATIILWLEN
ncbi:hypothetical protein SPSYN_00771 [Sporotomaculum syntrophicum]|uniref:Anti-sigma-W factor RsiW n=1 Tax=Sporotomaculum syntrophicum TaxID=182264 RepID=A0A9D2WRI3_9FIRM|nr:zf-HC2 domain-containing protein [Sporotomaculum syntrophicum]KAF1086033.1 hypothetical protein SPSYN_00771 [Sporotomaculum syntrophicum]